MKKYKKSGKPADTPAKHVRRSTKRPCLSDTSLAMNTAANKTSADITTSSQAKAAMLFTLACWRNKGILNPCSTTKGANPRYGTRMPIIVSAKNNCFM